MSHLRLISLTAAGFCAAGGLAVGALCLMAGSIDQAVAFTWPGLGAAMVFALTAPGETVG